MSVILSSIGRVKPGCYQEFLAQSAQASKLYQQLGAGTPRLLTAGLAGQAFGAWTFSMEFDDLDAFGAASDRFQTDPEAQAFMVQMQAASNPSTLEQVSVSVEVPVRESKGGRGSVVVVYASRIHPGALEPALDLGAKACAFAEAHGALDARLFNLIGAGTGTGLVLTVWELENMRSYAKVMDAFTIDAAGQELATRQAAADAPATTVFEAVYNEIPFG